MLQSNLDQSISNKKLKIGIYDISLPEHIDKPQIVLQKENSPDLKVAEFNRWGADLSIMIKNTIINNLSAALPNAIIVPLSYGANSEYIVKINIEKLTGWLNNKAILKANWQILNTTSKTIIAETSTFENSAGKNYSSYVIAQSNLLSELSLNIANKLKNL